MFLVCNANLVGLLRIIGGPVRSDKYILDSLALRQGVKGSEYCGDAWLWFETTIEYGNIGDGNSASTIPVSCSTTSKLCGYRPIGRQECSDGVGS